MRSHTDSTSPRPSTFFPRLPGAPPVRRPKLSKSRIKRLRGFVKPQYRLRIGDIRVFYDIEEERVEVLAIVPKSEAAEWLAQLGEEE